MICEPCVWGARHNTKGRELLAKGQPDQAQDRFDYAVKHHEDCERNCACQHMVGNVKVRGRDGVEA